MHDHTPDVDGYIWPTCDPCGRDLRHDELDRRACRLCQERVDLALRQLAGPVTWEGVKKNRRVVSGLYAALTSVLTPGGGGNVAHVSGSRIAPVPPSLDVLNLMTERGPIVGKLEAWVRDWESFGRADVDESGTLQQRVDHTVRTLRFNLAWAAAYHPAFGDFLDEVIVMVRQCERQITGERAERPIVVACPCGTTLRVTVSTPGARCRGCGTQYARSDVLELPIAERVAA
jgi:hypothetical protein